MWRRCARARPVSHWSADSRGGQPESCRERRDRRPVAGRTSVARRSPKCSARPGAPRLIASVPTRRAECAYRSRISRNFLNAMLGSPVFIYCMEMETTVAPGWLSLSGRPAAKAIDRDQLVADHQQMVYRIAYSVLRNPHDASDAAPATFLRLFRAAGQLAGTAYRNAS